jgi:tripartite-type tricarboxylate transporter receptor subunit TctC
MQRRAIFAATAVLLLAGGASAQEYPTHTITMIVPFAAGGPTDTVARLVAEPMTKTLGQQVIVENVGGAGGTLGASRVAKADPDGYTLLMHHIGQATSASLYRKLTFDPATAFEPIGLVTDVPMTIVARSDLEPGNVGELIEYIKTNKDQVTLANAGIGSASHLCGMLLMKALDTPMTTVPYKGTGPAMTDLMGGQVDLLCDQTTNTTSQIKSGKIKGYAVTTETPVKSLPDLPTLASSGLENFEVAIWHGLYAPAGTPQPVIDKLANALQQALQDPKVVERFADLGTEPVAQERATPEALGQQLQAEIAKWKPIIQEAGVYAD